jgi:N-acetylglutamate synthase-like GNAT family acetyltransferase
MGIQQHSSVRGISIAGKLAVPEIVPLPVDHETLTAAAKLISDEWKNYSYEHTLEHLKSELDNHSVLFTLVARRNGEVLGTVSCEERLQRMPKLGPALEMLVVHPEHRGEGIGTELLEETLTRVRALGHPTVYLATATAQDFYRAHGFTFHSTIPGPGGLVNILRYDFR